MWCIRPRTKSSPVPLAGFPGVCNIVSAARAILSAAINNPSSRGWRIAMLILEMRRAEVTAEACATFDVFTRTVPASYRPLLRPTIELQAGILGLPAEIGDAGVGPTRSRIASALPSRVRRAEIFTDGSNLLALEVAEVLGRPIMRRNEDGSVTREQRQSTFTLMIYSLAAEPKRTPLQQFEQLVESGFAIKLEGFRYPSNRFGELLADGRQPAMAPSGPSRVG